MRGIDLLRLVYELLPLVFAIDLLTFHFTGDHPLAMRWWWRRSSNQLPNPSAHLAR
jgi:hypothetical protein